MKKLKFEPCLKNVLPFYICISQTVIDLPNYGPGIYFITACKRAHGYQKGHISKVRIGFYSVFYHFFSLLWLFIKCTSWCFIVIIYQRKPNNPIWRQKNPPQQWFCLNTIIQFFKLCRQTFSSVSLFFQWSYLPPPFQRHLVADKDKSWRDMHQRLNRKLATGETIAWILFWFQKNWISWPLCA